MSQIKVLIKKQHPRYIYELGDSKNHKHSKNYRLGFNEAWVRLSL